MKRFLFPLLLFITCSAWSQNTYKEISLPDLAQKIIHSPKSPVIIDVRSPGEYMDTMPGGRHSGIGRLKTAINVPIQDLFQQPGTIQQLEQYKQDDIYIICSHSYRSRRVSNLLLQNGFTKVINVKGGMSEWYRNYDELHPYASAVYENTIAYQNLAPAQFFKLAQSGKPAVVIGFQNPPAFFFDSLIAPYYPYFPDIHGASYFRQNDSLQILEKVKAANGKPVILFNRVGRGSAENAEWLVKRGYKNIFFLVGGMAGYFEYLANYQPGMLKKLLTANSQIEFYTPLHFCRAQPANVQWIDLRHDTTFNQVTHGTKLDYKTMKGAVNFPFYRSADDFAIQFPDKRKLYMLLPENGFTGVELADALTKKGYRIGWLIEGLERWEWYTNNIVNFACKDYFIK